MNLRPAAFPFLLFVIAFLASVLVRPYRAITVPIAVGAFAFTLWRLLQS